MARKPIRKLISESRRLWDRYYAHPTQSNLRAYIRHHDQMKARQSLAGQAPLVDEVHALAGETAMLIDEQVVHDPAQPGTRLLDFHDFVQQAEGLDKQFLEQVLGLGFATGQAPGKTIQPVEVRPHDSLEYVALVCFSHRTAECIASRGASDKDALCYS